MDKLIIIVLTIKIYGFFLQIFPLPSSFKHCRLENPPFLDDFPIKTRSCPCPRLLFEDGEPLTFGEFMDAMLTLRGSNSTTVKDIADLAAVNTRHVWRWWWRPWEEVQETMAMENPDVWLWNPHGCSELFLYQTVIFPLPYKKQKSHGFVHTWNHPLIW